MTSMDLHGARIMVTGGAGLIGSHIVERLLDAGVGSVVVYDSFTRGTRANLSRALSDPRCEIFADGAAEVQDASMVHNAMDGVDGVCHLAAVLLLQCRDDPRNAFEVNFRGTFNVIEAALRRGVKRLVYSSSASVYGNALTLPIAEDHPYNNTTFYGAAKIAGEHMLKSLATHGEVGWVALRYTNVYGPRQNYHGAYVAIIHEMLDAIERGSAITIPGDGSQTYDFIFVEDVARANVLALGSSCTGFYNIATGVGTTLNELAAHLQRLTGVSVAVQHSPAPVGLVTRRVAGTDAAERDMYFRAEIMLDEGLRRLIEWRSSVRSAAGGWVEVARHATGASGGPRR